MKKFFALCLALCLCIVSLTALAETATETYTIECEPTFEGEYVYLNEETGLIVCLPTDWESELVEGVLAAANADQSVTMMAMTVEGDLSEVVGQSANTDTVTVGSANINGIDYVLIDINDKSGSMAMCQLDETSVLTFTFAFPNGEPEGISQTLVEIIGSIGFEEAEEAAE